MDKRDSLPSRAKRYDVLARLWSDDRFTNGHSDVEVRDFIERVYWYAWTRQKGPALDNQAYYRYLFDGNRRNWLRLLSFDRPRYEPNDPGFDGAVCEFVLTRGPRVGEPCGKRQTLRFRVTDPATGEWRWSMWCSQHREPGRAAQWHESHREGREHDPTPHPNRGGILPCYLDLSNGKKWETAYKEAHRTWEPPAVGVCADGWDVLKKVHLVVRRPKLTLIVGGLDGTQD